MGVRYLPRAQEGSIIDVINPRGYVTSTSQGERATIRNPTYQPAAPVQGDVSDAILDAFNQYGLGSGSSSGSSQGSSWNSQVVLPPVMELLMEMRARRDSLAQRQNILADILSANTPQGQKNYLGFEPGGIADVLMGLITGEGPSAGARILPADQRAVRRQALPVPGGEPSVADEFGGGMDMATLILNALRTIATGGSQQSSQQSSAQQQQSGGSQPSAAALAEALGGLGGVTY